MSYWFKPKKYGYGVYPISWQGWFLTAVFILLILANGYSLLPFLENNQIQYALLRFFLDLIIIIALFLLFIKNKIKGELKFRWGK